MASIITISDWQITFSTLGKNYKMSQSNNLPTFAIMIGRLLDSNEKFKWFWGFLWCFMRKFMVLMTV